jgi:diguanylate cyclase (GGDEF)-like protein
MKKQQHVDTFLFSLATAVILASFFFAFVPRKHADPSESGIAEFSVLKDDTKALELMDVMRARGLFESKKTPRYYDRHTESAIWLRLKIAPAVDPEATRFLQIPNVALENITVYFPGAPGIRAGRTVPFSKLPLASRYWSFSIPESLKAEDEVYVRIESTSIMLVPAKVITFQELLAENFSVVLYYGVFFGMLIAIFFVNIFSFIVVKNRNFLIYALYLLSLVVYHVSVHAFLYYLPIPFAIQSAILWIGLCGVGVFMIFFAKKFMNLRETMPAVNLILDVNLSLFVVQAVAAILVSTRIANAIGYVTGLIVPIVILISAIIRYRSGDRHLRFYILALSAMVAGTLIWAGAAYMETWISANHFFIAGTTLDSLLFTLAIFDQIKCELTEKEVLGAREQYYIDLSRTDALTGLYNRRYLNELIKRLGADEELPTVSSLIMLDLDNFKTINDTYGHLIGDMLLTKTATKIKKHIRKTDIACRYGGDEFLIYLPGANASIAHSIADGVRRDILDDFSYSEEGTEIRHTISIGVTENRVDDTFDGLFLRADAALYQAKRTGRNKISIL